MRRTLATWAARLMARRPPDFVIGEPGDIYLERWWVIPRNKFFNIYLHRFLRSDDDRALHDHPWVNMSYIISGGYCEVTPKGEFVRKPGSFAFRRAKASHRVVLFRDQLDKISNLWATRHAISLFFTGPVIRHWGFHCPKGWVYWKDFVSMTPGGNKKGPGCDSV